MQDRILPQSYQPQKHRLTGPFTLLLALASAVMIVPSLASADEVKVVRCSSTGVCSTIADLMGESLFVASIDNPGHTISGVSFAGFSFDPGTVSFTEPGTLLRSDNLNIAANVGNPFYLPSLTSDPANPGVCNPTFSVCLDEGVSATVSATVLWTGGAIDTITFSSDAGVAAVPEPAPMLLLLTGLAWVGLKRKGSFA